MKFTSRYDSAPLQDDLEITNPRWRLWFQNVWTQLNAIALPLPTTAALGASPATYQFLGAGTSSALITGGTVTKVEFSRDAVTWYDLNLAVMVTLSQGDYLRVTYAVLPTLTLVIR